MATKRRTLIAANPESRAAKVTTARRSAPAPSNDDQHVTPVKSVSKARKIPREHWALQFSYFDWDLFEKTGNGYHAWVAIHVWLIEAPDLQMPPEYLDFIAKCTRRFVHAKTAPEIVRAFGLSRPKTGPGAERSGGSGGKLRAEKIQKRKGVFCFLLNEPERRRRANKYKRENGLEGEESEKYADIRADAAKKFGFKIGTVKNIETQVGLHKLRHEK